MVKHIQQRIPEHGWAEARRVLARTLFKEMKDGGLSPHQMMEFTSELLTLVGEDIGSKETRQTN